MCRVVVVVMLTGAIALAMLFAAASLGNAGSNVNSAWWNSAVNWMIGAAGAAGAAAVAVILRGRTERECDAQLDRIRRTLAA